MSEGVACDIEMGVQICLAKNFIEVIFHGSYGEAVSFF